MRIERITNRSCGTLHRILAYIYLKNGTFVNAWLVENGYAMVMTFPPNIKYEALFLKLQREAREANRGLWKEGG